MQVCTNCSDWYGNCCMVLTWGTHFRRGNGGRGTAKIGNKGEEGKVFWTEVMMVRTCLTKFFTMHERWIRTLVFHKGCFLKFLLGGRIACIFLSFRIVLLSKRYAARRPTFPQAKISSKSSCRTPTLPILEPEVSSEIRKDHSK